MDSNLRFGACCTLGRCTTLVRCTTLARCATLFFSFLLMFLSAFGPDAQAQSGEFVISSDVYSAFTDIVENYPPFELLPLAEIPIKVLRSDSADSVEKLWPIPVICNLDESHYCAAAAFGGWSCSAISCRCGSKIGPGSPIRTFFLFSDIGADSTHDRVDQELAADSCGSCTPVSNTVRCVSLRSIF